MLSTPRVSMFMREAKEPDVIDVPSSLLSPSFAYGASHGVRDNLWYLEAHRVLYCVGRHLLSHDCDTTEMALMPLRAEGNIPVQLCMTSSRKYVACVEGAKEGEKQQVSVYSVAKARLLRTFMMEETLTEARQILDVSFSAGDGKLLAIQCGPPDYVILCWRWYARKVVAVVLPQLRDPPLCVQFNPWEEHDFVVMSCSQVREFKIDLAAATAKGAKPLADTLQGYNLQKGLPHEFRCVCWLLGGLLAVGDSLGRVLIYHDGTCTHAFTLSALAGPHVELSPEEEDAEEEEGESGELGAQDTARHTSDPSPPTSARMRPKGVQCLVERGRSCVAVDQQGVVFIFDPPDATSGQRGVLGASEAKLRYCGAVSGLKGSDLQGMAVSSTDDQLAVMTAGGLVLVVDLMEIMRMQQGGGSFSQRSTVDDPLLWSSWGNNLQLEEEQVSGESLWSPFKLVFGGALTGPVASLSVCPSSPLVLAGSADGELMLWDFQRHQAMARRTLDHHILSTALHPSGHIAAVGMPDRLRLFQVVRDDFPLLAELPVKQCGRVLFSHGGHLLAAVGRNQQHIFLYATQSQRLLATFKAHSSAITSLHFSPDDYQITSVGIGGACYVWDIVNDSRIADEEYIDKQCMYVACSYLNKTPGVLVATRDGRLQHLYQGQVLCEVQLSCRPTAMLVLGSNELVLLADEHGAVRARHWPLAGVVPPQDTPRPKEPQAEDTARPPLMTSVLVLSEPLFVHHTHFNHMEYGHGLVFTASDTSSVIMATAVPPLLTGSLSLHAPHPDAGIPGLMPPEALRYMLVGYQQYDELTTRVKDLKGQLGAVKEEAAYQVLGQTQTLRDQCHRLQGEVERLKEQLLDKTNRHEELRVTAEDREKQMLKALESLHLSAADHLEILYQKRLELEHAQYQQLLHDKEDQELAMKEKVVRLERQHKEELAELHQSYRTKLRECAERLEAASEVQESLERYYNEMLDQTEADMEEQSDRAEGRLVQAQKDAGSVEMKLKAENNLLKRDNARLRSEKEQEMEAAKKHSAAVAALQAQIDEHKKTIEKLKVEIVERDNVIGDNYHTLQGLRRKIQDLEKHKFVLTYKAESYQKELEPHTAEVVKLRKQLASQDKEVVAELAHMREVSQSLAEKEAYIKGLKSEMAELKRTSNKQAALLSSISDDLFQVMSASDDRPPGGLSARQKMFMTVYKKYCHGESVQTSAAAQAHLMRHLQVAETKVAILEARLQEVERREKRHTHELAHDNQLLLTEMAEMQRQHRTAQLSHLVSSTSATSRGLTGWESIPGPREEQVDCSPVDMSATHDGKDHEAELCNDIRPRVFTTTTNRGPASDTGTLCSFVSRKSLSPCPRLSLTSSTALPVTSPRRPSSAPQRIHSARKSSSPSTAPPRSPGSPSLRKSMIKDPEISSPVALPPNMLSQDGPQVTPGIGQGSMQQRVKAKVASWRAK